MKTTIILAFLLLFVSNEKPNLTGRWETMPSPKGNITTVLFRPDSTYEGYVNKKPFVSGRYSLQDSIMTITELGCDGKQGTYKLIFFSNEDSLRFQSIADSCNERREGMNRIVLGRVK